MSSNAWHNPGCTALKSMQTDQRQEEHQACHIWDVSKVVFNCSLFTSLWMNKPHFTCFGWSVQSIAFAINVFYLNIVNNLWSWLKKIFLPLVVPAPLLVLLIFYTLTPLNFTCPQLQPSVKPLDHRWMAVPAIEAAFWTLILLCTWICTWNITVVSMFGSIFLVAKV